MKSVIRNFLLTTAVLVSAPLAANGPELRFGLDIGGAEIGRLEFIDGSSSSIDSGSGVYVEAGYQFQTPLLHRENLSTELSVGYKTDGAYASNLSVDFSRFTTSLTQYVYRGRARFGLGFTGHFRNKLSIESNNGGNFEDMINNSYGVALLADMKLRSDWRIGMRLVSMDYTNYGEKFSANSAGIFMGYAFK